MNKPVVPYRTGPSVWYGSNMKHRKAEWLWQLSKHEILELEKAAELALHKNSEIGKLTIEQFPLDSLKSKLMALRQELIHGRGFSLIRGLPIHRYTQAIFYGIGLHIGNPRSQNAKGHIIGHVKDMGVSSSAGYSIHVSVSSVGSNQKLYKKIFMLPGLILLSFRLDAGEEKRDSTYLHFSRTLSFRSV